MEVLDNAKENFELAHQITEKKWVDYKNNTGCLWAKGEFESLQKLMKNQVELLDGDSQGYCIKAKLDKRQAHVKYRVQTGTRMQSTYSPGFTIYSSSNGGI